MHIAVFGATGGTGRQVVTQAVARGHTVTALARTPAKLDDLAAGGGVTVIQGDVLDSDAVAQTVTGADAVVVSLGNTSNNPDFVVSTGTARVVEAMQQAGVKRLLVVSSLGVGESKRQVPFFFRLLMWTVLRRAMRDKERQEALVKASDLNWTIVRPGGLSDEPATGDYRYGLDRSIKAGRISRADVADFVLKQVQSDEFLCKAPAVT